MSNYKKFARAINNKINGWLDSNVNLYRVDLKGDDLWDMYLASFPEGSDPVYKERTDHDCQCCRNFIKNMGNVVQIIDNQVVSFWKLSNLPYPYDEVCSTLSEKVGAAPVVSPFLSTQRTYSVPHSLQQLENGAIHKWEHMYAKIPSNRCPSDAPTQIGHVVTSYAVFKRTLTELTLNAGETILELIDANNLYRGAEHKPHIQDFIKFKKEFDAILVSDQSNWLWANLYTSNRVTLLRNSALGTLLINLSAGEDPDVAVGKFEAVMAPSNYKRPKAIFTKKMIKDAEDAINKMGLADALPRRFARLEDISVNDVIFVDRSIKGLLKNKSIFEELQDEAVKKPKEFKRVSKISIEDFVNNIVPKSNKLEVYVENKHSSNFVSLIAPEDQDAPALFQWDNNFCWNYSGDITDSMKAQVKAAGGRVDGVLRFSIRWNEEGKTNSDYDAHCHEPDGSHIYYANRHRTRPSGGDLDVDITSPQGRVAVENITWPDRRKMKDGQYKFLVHNFSKNGGRGGFQAEIEFNGEILEFNYEEDLRDREFVEVAIVDIQGNKMTIVKSLPSTTATRNIWGVSTNDFAEVSIMTLSPNYWGNKEIGNKHYLFMLNNCVNEDTPRGFFNEFLKSDLSKHKRVFEALGAKMRVQPTNRQLSGLGFSSTKNTNVIVRVSGNTKQVFDVQF